MPSAITAIRRYPVTLLLAGLLFLASFVIATGTFGIAGTGGGDDEGSGIGGTGRTGDFGGSGLGGTGAPSPFWGQADTKQETQETIEPDLVDPMLVTPASTQLALSLVLDTTLDTQLPLSPKGPALTELTENLDAQAIALENNHITMPSPASTVTQSTNVQLVELSEPASARSVPALNINIQPDRVEKPTPESSVAQTPDIVPLMDIVRDLDELQYSLSVPEGLTVEQISEPQQLADSVTPTTEMEQNAKRLDIPDRIQRPELPPIQRLRPVERVSIMPPRALPMRI